MWIKIIHLICLHTFLASGLNSNVEKIISNNVFEAEKSRETFRSSNCVSDISGNSLTFECELFNDVYIIIKGSIHLDSELVIILHCIEQQIPLELNITGCATTHNDLRGRLFNNSTNLNVYELHINFADFVDDSYFDFYTSKYRYIKEMHWHENGECSRLTRLVKKFKYLYKLNVYFAFYIPCGYYFDYFSDLTQIKELQIELKMGIYQDHPFFLRDLKNLEVLNINITSESQSFSIPNQLFRGLTKLSSLTLNNCNIFTGDSFHDLVNLQYMSLTSERGIISLNSGVLWLLKNSNKFLVLETNAYIDLSSKPETKTFICQDSNNCIFGIDINNKRCPQECHCSLNRPEMRFKINCDNYKIGTKIPELPIPITGNTCLYFTNKSLTQLPNSTLYGYSNVTELHLANNKLTNITDEQLPNNLTFLDLRNNSIEYLNKKVIEFLSARAGKISMKLSGNPWKCNCNFRDMFKFIADFSNRIGDRENIKYRQEYLEIWTFLLNMGFCNPIVYITFGCLLALTIILIIYFYTKKSIIMWLYERNLCLKWISIPEPKTDIGLKIDAFLAFSHKDLELIKEYVEKLEKGPREYQLCFYQRDWLIGESIPKCILTSIEVSKRIIILMTNNFVSSSWGLFELRSAIRVTSMDKSKRLIIILYPEVDIEKLDSELKMYMKYNTYLRRDDPFFWRKLMFSMPHKQIFRGVSSLREARAIEETQL